jgi:CDP-2,3-bis-(O-geranylgeranyl)-sn-glycerol synthase
MLDDILLAFWFLLPAAAANVTPIFVRYLPLLKKWDTPLDFGYDWRGKRLFGDHKTWRGVISGGVVAAIVFMFQVWLNGNYLWAQLISTGIDYSSLPYFFGALLGLGALGGDAAKSFFKRRIGVMSGERWIPFDQLDYVIGGILISLPFIILSLTQYIWIIVVWFVMHIFASYIGWLIGVKDKPI